MRCEVQGGRHVLILTKVHRFCGRLERGGTKNRLLQKNKDILRFVVVTPKSRVSFFVMQIA